LDYCKVAQAASLIEKLCAYRTILRVLSYKPIPFLAAFAGLLHSLPATLYISEMAPMIEETMSALRGLVSGAWCARRKEAPMMLNTGAAKGHSVTGFTSPDPSSKFLKQASDSEDNAEISTACPTCESDLAVGSTDASTDGSDAEVDSPSSQMQKASPEDKMMPMWIPPPPGLCSPGVAPPPGLELPPQTAMKSMQNEKPQCGTRLKSQAAPFVPSAGLPDSSNQFDMASQNLHQKLCQLKGALAEWEACMPKTSQSTPANHVPSNSLQDMLNTEKHAQDLSSMVSSFMAAANTGVSSGFPMGPTPTVDMLAADMLAMDMAAGHTQFPAAMPQIMNPQVAMNNMAWPNINAQPWGGVSTPSYQPQSWQRGPRQGGKTAKSQAVRMTQEEADDQKETLRTNLRVLETMDASKVIIVRRINRLGLDSAAMLKSHFSQYGVVDQIFVSHSRVRSTNRVRPAGLGFLVMSSEAEAKAILSMGHEQVVKGVIITLQPYEDRVAEGDDQTGQASQFEFQ